jgi:hypothetical protein
MNLKQFILSGIFFISLGSIVAQNQSFDIFLFGKKIGTMTIEKTNSMNGVSTYKLRSKSEATVLFTKKKNELEFDVVYKDGFLFSSYSKNTVNDEVENYASASWDGAKYVCQNEQKKFTVGEKALYSVVMLYFKEPVGVTRIFSERIGDFADLKNVSPGVYEFKMPNGDKNIYHFENGKIKEVEMKKSIGTAYMRPSK